MELMISVLEQGLIFSVLALGVMMTNKILNIADLTVDGTIVLGAAITGSLLVNGTSPWVATFVAMIGGSLAGLTTALLHVRLKISSLLSGVLVMFGLYSINLRIMKTPNLSLFQHDNVFNQWNQWLSWLGLTNSTFNHLLLLIVIVIILHFVLNWFLSTKLGLLLKTAGDNPKLLASLGANLDHMKIIGLMLANALVGLAGSLLTQYNRFTDVNSGTGTLVIGLASIIIGQTVFKRLENRFLKTTTTIIIGSIIYKGLQTLTIQLGLNTNDFKLISALLVVVALGVSNKQWSFPTNKRKNGKQKEAVQYVHTEVHS